jgi:hypothetical protein
VSDDLSLYPKRLSPCSFGLSATSRQYFSLRTNQPPETSQQYLKLVLEANHVDISTEPLTVGPYQHSQMAKSAAHRPQRSQASVHTHPTCSWSVRRSESERSIWITPAGSISAARSLPRDRQRPFPSPPRVSRTQNSKNFESQHRCRTPSASLNPPTPPLSPLKSRPPDPQFPHHRSPPHPKP